MPVRRTTVAAFLLAILLAGCATLRLDPVNVIVAGVEPLAGEGLELRMLVKLRIQNPNDQPLDFDGVSLLMNVQGRRFATGVSDAAGRVPRFGELLVDVPVSSSVLGMARRVLEVVSGEAREPLSYEISGKLGGPGFESFSFQSKGQLTLPAGIVDGRK